MQVLSVELIVCAVILNSVVLANKISIKSRISEDGHLNFTELARKYGQGAAEYNVITEDGYILKLNRIFGDERQPVMLSHGVLGSADDFIMRGNTSIAIALAQAGYDVWAINFRGSRYSRRHRTLNPDIDAAFWNFSIHEHGLYDMQANIDFVLNKTLQNKLIAIGFSQGTTAMYILGTMRPDYNKKINVFISLAPICYLHDTKPFLSYFIRWSPDINRGLKISQTEEFAGFNSVFKQLWNYLCTQNGLGYYLCLIGSIFQVTGVDGEEVEEDFWRVVVGHFPAGTSRKNLYHFAQIGLRERFARFDYGQAGNRIVYNSKDPPEYNLKKVTMKVALFVAKNDRISTIKSLDLLRKQLPNVVFYKIMKPSTFNHLDFVWGRNTHKTMFLDVFKLLDDYK